MSDNPNIGPVNSIEATVAEFHQRRRHLIDCLRYLFEAAELAHLPDPPRLYLRLEAFVRQELVPATKSVGPDTSLASRIFKEIESLGAAFVQAQTARQNAQSNTVPPSGSGAAFLSRTCRAAHAVQGSQPSLGYDILDARCDSLKYERRHLSMVYYQIARLGYLSLNEVQKSIDWLAVNSNDATVFYVLAATLAAFDPADPHSFAGKVRKNLAIDKASIAYMKRQLALTANWKEPGLKATVLLKWTLFMTEARHRDPTLENQEGFKTEELESQIWSAVQGDAFTFLAATLIQFQKRTHTSPISSFAQFVQLVPEQQEQPQREPLADEFKLPVLNTCDVLIRSLLTYASSELRKIKQRQEDVLASVRTDRSRMFRSAAPISVENENQPAPRNDIAMLYSLIGILYTSLPPERALQFWGATPLGEAHALSYMEITEMSTGKLPSFLQWAVWSTQVRDVNMTMALYDMLSGLAKGQQCSELAYNFLARGGGEVIPGSSLPSSTASYSAGPSISWTTIFALLESWASPASSPRGNQPPQQSLAASFGAFGSLTATQPPPPPVQQPPQHIPIGPKDVLLAQSFLRLLSTVATSSVAVRLAISSHTQFRAIPTLVSLVPLGIPLELKGAIFDALAAFCEPGAGVAGVDICKSVWTLMERVEVINVRASVSGRAIGAGAVLPPVKGVEVELDEVEAVYKLYPATIPFLNLLATLLHTPKRLSPRSLLADAEPLNTIPESLGQPYRLPGIGPYVNFVVDNVFAGLPRREYARHSERWRMNDLCLKFVERALAGWEIENLVRTEDGVLKRETVVPLLIHPGFEVLTRLLTNSPLQSTILSYIVDGIEGFERELPSEEPYFLLTIIRVLRIIHRVLDIQDIFLDVLVPILSEFDSAPFVGSVHSRSFYTRFDQALTYGTKYIPAIATYAVYPAYPELVLLAVKIISQISSSASVTSLLTLIERSPDSERILSGFRQLLDVEALDDVEAAETTVEQSTGAGAADRETQEPFDQAIRVAILDLLIRNTEPRTAFPNIGHFLLFGGPENDHQIQDPHAIGARRTCVHVILDLVNVGVPRMKKGGDRERQRRAAIHAEPLFNVLPALGERCYRIIHQLCVHPCTSDATMRYLRTREDFFVRHLAAIPSRVPEVSREPFIEVMYPDGSRVLTSVSTLRAFISLRSWILDLAALDLHVLTNKGHHKGILEILQILFGTENTQDMGEYEWEDELGMSLQPFREMGQSHLRIIEFVQSLSFDWSDSLTTSPVDLEYLGSLNLHACARVDSTGCEVVDQSALLSLLMAACRTLHSQGRIATTAQAERVSVETAYILESCAIENHRREVSYAVSTGYEAWRRLLDMALAKCFNRLPHDRRENMLFDLLHVLPEIMRSDVQEATAVLLSEAILSTITKLREDRRHQIMLQSAGGDIEAGSLPTERLYALLKSLVEGTLDNNRSELVRGNLYACLINYLHLVSADDGHPDTEVVDTFGKRSVALSVSALSWKEDMSLAESQGGSMRSTPTPTRPMQSTTALETGTLSAMKSVLERLVTTISRDAIDGTEVWKTVAFTLLDALTHLCRADKSRVLLSTLVKYGVLSNFVKGVKEAEMHLQYVLKPDPGVYFSAFCFVLD